MTAHRLASFFRLPASERRLAARALATLAIVRLALFLIPFPLARKGVDRWSGDGQRETPNPATAEAVRRALERAARTLPGSACLAQALTAEVLLRRAGQSVEVSIGVAPGVAPGASSVRNLLNAHAWARSAGVLVAGDRADLSSYRTLAVFGSDSWRRPQ
ncbi:MAG: lasso peptide biosynthesis B2 protein [Gemmatimonadaceae bacterium]|nr:lasso peptide biosynthesis B2 protein [Gemmatimonadaceae bacterium]